MCACGVNHLGRFECACGVWVCDINLVRSACASVYVFMMSINRACTTGCYHCCHTSALLLSGDVVALPLLAKLSHSFVVGQLIN